VTKLVKLDELGSFGGNKPTTVAFEQSKTKTRAGFYPLNLVRVAGDF
jgi:hypothetical protein